MRFSERDLAALRAGIEKQAQHDAWRENFQHDLEARLARKRVEYPRLVPGSRLNVGDVLCATEDGRNFYEHAEITSFDEPPQPYRGDRWMSVKYATGSGTGASAVKDFDLFLVAR